MARIMPIRPKRSTKPQPAAGCPVPGLIAGRKPINLALQGGGAHGAFAWGVIDRLLEDGRIDIDGVSGTSAGSMNAVVFAHGRLVGGHEGARQALEDFWKAVSDAGQRYSPIRKAPWESMLAGWSGEANFAFEAFKLMTNAMSPYQWN